MKNIYNLNSNLRDYLLDLIKENFNKCLLTLNFKERKTNIKFDIKSLNLDNILINNSLNLKEFTNKDIFSRIISYTISAYDNNKTISLFFDQNNDLYYIYLILAYNSFSLSSERTKDNFVTKTSINDFSKLNPFLLEKKEFSTFEQLEKLKQNLIFI